MVSRRETMKMKNKILDNLPIIFVALVFVFGMTLTWNHAKADTDWQSGKYDFKWQHVPVVCGTTDEIQKYLDDNNFELSSISVGREGAKKEGDIAYLVTYYLSKDRTETISAITSPTGSETCMMYRSFDLRVPGTQT